jgi:poly-gamma-glutamate synthesis protein (capsule biosynthesis protein)
MLAFGLGACVQSQGSAVASPEVAKAIIPDTVAVDRRDSTLVERIDSTAIAALDSTVRLGIAKTTVTGIDSAAIARSGKVPIVGVDSAADARIDRTAVVRRATTADAAIDSTAKADIDSAIIARIDTSGIAGVDTSRIVMRFAGDCLLGGHYERTVGANVGLAFENFSLFHSADVALVNLENPITTRGRMVPKTYNFRMHPRLVAALTGAGIGVVSIANNHVFDYGDEGLFDTFLYLDSAGVRYVGAGRNSTEAHRPYTFRKNSQSVSIFGYYGGGEAPAATPRRGGVAPRDLQLIARDVRAARGADSTTYIVVILHWGTEKAQAPDASQRAFARALIDAGVDAVIGHHPHVLQGIERYRKGVIVYSLGNFVFGGNTRHTYDTGIFEIILHHTQPAFRFIPIGVRQWRVNVLEGKDAERVTAQVRSLSQIFPSTIFTD